MLKCPQKEFTELGNSSATSDYTHRATALLVAVARRHSGGQWTAADQRYHVVKCLSGRPRVTGFIVSTTSTQRCRARRRQWRAAGGDVLTTSPKAVTLGLFCVRLGRDYCAVGCCINCAWPGPRPSSSILPYAQAGHSHEEESGCGAGPRTR